MEVNNIHHNHHSNHSEEKACEFADGSPAEIGRRAKHGVSPVLMPTCPLRPWINQLEPVIFRPDSQNYVREKKTRLSAEERDLVNINTLVTW